MRHTITAALALVVAVSSGQAQHVQQSQTPNTIRELFAYLGQCVHFPAGSEGSEITLRFSITHQGALRGPPMVTYSKLTGDEAAQRRFVAAALDALDKCMPVRVTDLFGKIASRKMITWRLRNVREDAI
jgi:hypothetical protein